jgi:ADP-ribose pyrophosphatase
MKPDETRTAWAGKHLAVSIERWGERDVEIVEHPGSVAIVAVDEEDRVVLVRQPREPARKRLIELPAGTLEEGEEPEATARRELEEETGLSGGRWRSLGRFWTSPGFLREDMHLFLADELDQGEPHTEEDEEIELVRWSRAEVERRLSEIEDAKTLAGLLLYLRVSDSSEPD